MTSTGETKVIERFDCSGSGDVDTSTIIRKVTDGGITGLTGRKLKVNTGLFCCCYAAMLLLDLSLVLRSV